MKQLTTDFTINEQQNAEQLGLFDEAENSVDPKDEEKVTIEEITYNRKKRTGKRADDISELRLETIVSSIPLFLTILIAYSTHKGNQSTDIKKMHIVHWEKIKEMQEIE